jgi:superoxide dismutase, Cu-Zn family
MMKTRALLLTAASLSLACPGLTRGTPPAPPPQPEVPTAPPSDPEADTGAVARAEVKNLEGQTIGQVMFFQGPHGTLVRGAFTNLPPGGGHALHVHETGLCEPPFKTAGGHFNPTSHQHGFLAPRGLHAGDLPNLHVAADGTAKLDFFARHLTVRSMDDQDGSAVILHAGSDDYHTDPSGNAGDRIACGVVRMQQAPPREDPGNEQPPLNPRH